MAGGDALAGGGPRRQQAHWQFFGQRALVVAEHVGQPVALKVTSIDRPGLFEQFWRMGLSQSLEQWLAAMEMQQLPIFNTW